MIWSEFGKLKLTTGSLEVYSYLHKMNMESGVSFFYISTDSFMFEYMMN